MKLSTKGRYGVRLMINLAGKYGEGPILLRDIAEQEEVSEKYLSNLTTHLLAVGLLRSSRGVNGGYFLGRPPEEITVKDVVTVLEGPLCIVDCVGRPSECKRSAHCISRDVWCEAAEALAEILGKYTLADMVERQKSRQDCQAQASPSANAYILDNARRMPFAEDSVMIGL